MRVIFCDASAYDAGYLAPEDIAGRVKVKNNILQTNRFCEMTPIRVPHKYTSAVTAHPPTSNHSYLLPFSS